MDYAMNTASVKGKKELRLIITPANSLEREFFNNLFASGKAIIETVANSDDIIIREPIAIPPDDLPF